MMDKLIKKDFLKKYNLESTYEKSQLSWRELELVYKDYIQHLNAYHENARVIVNQLINYKSIHSIGYRIKDPEHLLAKIIRKKAENPKRNFDVEHYFQEIDDLIGVRILHVFKSEWHIVDQIIREKWELKETPTWYYRAGDVENYQVVKNAIKNVKQIKNMNFKVHNAGYRSIHYVIKFSPTKKEIKAELQVRTIFEEGWSEIDHNIKYPFYKENKLINEFLLMFNEIATNADKMGEFLKTLKSRAIIEENSELKMKNKLESLTTRIEQLEINQEEKSNILKELKDVFRKNELGK